MPGDRAGPALGKQGPCRPKAEKDRGLRHILQHLGEADLQRRLKLVALLAALPVPLLGGLLIWAKAGPHPIPQLPLQMIGPQLLLSIFVMRPPFVRRPTAFRMIPTRA